MWLFEKRGFVSVVAYNPDKDKVNKVHREAAKSSDNPTGWLLVRGRVLADIREVEKIIGHDIMVFEDKGADYQFRALVTREDFKKYMCQIVDDIDYGAHFKEVAEKNSTQGKERHSAMMTCWSAMARLQPNPPYGGYTTTYYGASSTTGKAGKGSGVVKDKEYYDKIFDGDDSDWYNWQPDGGWDSYRGTSASVVDDITSGTKSGTFKSPAPPATVPDFIPPTYWFKVPDLAKAFLNGMVLSDLSHDQIEAMDDEAYEMYFEASTRHAMDEILSAVDIESLCGEEVFASITGEENANG